MAKLRPSEIYARFLREEEQKGMEREAVRLEVESRGAGEPGKLDRLGVILPSDSDWRTENYFRLVELHRSKADVKRKAAKSVPRKIFQKGFPALGLWALKSSGQKAPNLPFLTIDAEQIIHWNDGELVTANQVLSRQENADFYKDSNPDRMRKVIGLVYDVLRYKRVLGEVLEDVEYFVKYPVDRASEMKVYLLLYDMICRGFSDRKEVMSRTDQDNFQREGLEDIHKRLWRDKIQIAATVARIRIRKQAQSLADLLPKRIRQASRIVSSPIVEGWMNIYRIPLNDIGVRFKRLGLARHVGREALPPLTFSEDHLLPFHYFCRPFTRSIFLNSPFVQNKEFIVQSRSHCLSGAVITEVLKNHELTGSVAQTDVVALPASGYIAALLSANQHFSSRLLLFGAGWRKAEYELYFSKVGVTNVEVIAEKFSEVDPRDPRLQGVVMVLASPASSNSSVRDPVDLSISKGGDILLLRELTSRQEGGDEERPRAELTARQRETLMRALSIPQVQGVIYETYSEFVIENSLLAESVVEEMNRWAAQKHFRDMLQQESVEEMELNEQDEPTQVKEIQKITRLDSKFMISMAEERGLFGSGNKEANPDLEKVISEERPSSSTDRRLPRARVNTERITSHTFSSKLKHVRESTLTNCERSRIAKRLTLTKIWWNALLGHIRFSLKKKRYRLKFSFPRTNVLYSRKRKRIVRLGTPEIIL